MGSDLIEYQNKMQKLEDKSKWTQIVYREMNKSNKAIKWIQKFGKNVMKSEVYILLPISVRSQKLWNTNRFNTDCCTM